MEESEGVIVAGMQNMSLTDFSDLKLKEEVFKEMFQTGLNHNNWTRSKTTYLVYRVISSHKLDFIRKTDCKEHAEDALIKDLARLYDSEGVKPLNVEIYISNSPCKSCALLILRFLKDRRQAEITIHAASLYNIRRASCSKTTQHYNSVDEEESKGNCDGLRQLMNHERCKMRVFDKKAWKDLLDILKLQWPPLDTNYTREVGENDRSRSEEDDKLSKDLDCINRQDESK